MTGLSLLFVVGTITTIVSILTKVLGLPDQIKKNYTRKSTAGVSTMFIVLLCLSYTSWTIYGLLSGDFFLVIGHGLGIITTGIVIIQIVLYRPRQ